MKPSLKTSARCAYGCRQGSIQIAQESRLLFLIFLESVSKTNFERSGSGWDSNPEPTPKAFRAVLYASGLRATVMLAPQAMDPSFALVGVRTCGFWRLKELESPQRVSSCRQGGSATCRQCTYGASRFPLSIELQWGTSPTEYHWPPLPGNSGPSPCWPVCPGGCSRDPRRQPPWCYGHECGSRKHGRWQRW